jgi:hypothetical protein
MLYFDDILQVLFMEFISFEYRVGLWCYAKHRLCPCYEWFFFVFKIKMDDPNRS